MRAKTNRIMMTGQTCLGAAAGFFLRRWQLTYARSASGALVPGDMSTWALGILCAAFALAIALLSRRLTKRGDYEASFSSGAPELIISVLAGLMVSVGNGMGLYHRVVNNWVAYLGICAGLCILATAADRFRGAKPPTALHILPCLYLVVRLIVEFKRWSIDAAVLDYCFMLFASICAMCGTYHLGGFCFGRGARRISVFWCMLGPVFAAICLADGGLIPSLIIGGMGLWLGINGWQLLED